MIDALAEDRTVGTIDLFDFDQFNMRAGVGILIADPHDRKKGYASAALTCIINYAFMTLRLHQLWCNILEGNEESLSLFMHHGFVVSATKKEWVRVNGVFITEFMLQMINAQA
jgi:diamine N-acetyltransferase